MRPRRSDAVLIAFMGAVLSACYSFVGRYRGDPTFTEIRAAEDGKIDEYVDALYQCPVQPSPEGELTFRDRSGKANPQAQLPEGNLVVRFGAFSDVHIREPGVKLFSDRESATFDHVIESFERDPVQEAFQAAVYAATLKTFDAMKGTPREPRFLVHLGDAMDAGTIAELYEFVSISRRPAYPLLNVVGNHDDAIFGNYKKELGYAKNAGPEFYPVGNLQTFLFMHRPGPRQISGLSWQLLPIPRNPRLAQVGGESIEPNLEEQSSCNPGSPSVANRAAPAERYTMCLGFDLYNREQAWMTAQCESYKGYYSYSTKGCDGTAIQLVVLDSTRKDKWGAWGDMSPEEVQWFKDRLAEPADLTLVFLHNRPEETLPLGCYSMPALVDALEHRPRNRPLVVFSGHVHSYTTQWHERAAYWELNLGSLEEYPQWASLIEVRRSGDRMFLRAQHVHPLLGQDSLEVLSDDDLNRALTSCRTDLAAQPIDPADNQLLEKSASCGFLGAVHDRRRMQHRGERLQSKEEAVQQANVVLNISMDPNAP